MDFHDPINIHHDLIGKDNYNFDVNLEYFIAVIELENYVEAGST